jgi:NADPH2:quinone reductase
MQAIRAAAPGGPEAMSLVTLDTPSPAAGEVLVRVQAAGVNFIDVYHRSGLYKVETPIRLGLEGAGVVEKVGEGVREFERGDVVAWSSVPGSYATHVLAAESKLVRVPSGIDARLAAAAMLQGMTAHYLVRSTFPLESEHTCLVQAAAGGVGLLLCQLGKRVGARVIGTVGSEEKAALAREAGASDTILYAKEDFEVAVRKLTEGRGVDVVYDSVGKSTFDKSLACIRPRGMMVSFGQSSGAIPAFDLLRLNTHGSLFLTRPNLAHYTATHAEYIARASDVLGLVESGELSLRIHAALPLEQAADAHRMLEGRETTGKVLLLP